MVGAAKEENTGIVLWEADTVTMWCLGLYSNVCILSFNDQSCACAGFSTNYMESNFFQKKEVCVNAAYKTKKKVPSVWTKGGSTRLVSRSGVSAAYSQYF